MDTELNPNADNSNVVMAPDEDCDVENVDNADDSDDVANTNDDSQNFSAAVEVKLEFGNAVKCNNAYFLQRLENNINLRR